MEEKILRWIVLTMLASVAVVIAVGAGAMSYMIVLSVLK